MCPDSFFKIGFPFSTFSAKKKKEKKRKEKKKKIDTLQKSHQTGKAEFAHRLNKFLSTITRRLVKELFQRSKNRLCHEQVPHGTT